jgi:hypothetical protein
MLPENAGESIGVTIPSSFTMASGSLSAQRLYMKTVEIAAL